MEITEKKENNFTIISFTGRLDASSAPEAEQKLNESIEASSKLIINLAALDYISSAGLRVLLVAAKKIRHSSGSLALCDMQEGVKEVFDISGFSSIFNIYASSEEAQKSME